MRNIFSIFKGDKNNLSTLSESAKKNLDKGQYNKAIDLYSECLHLIDATPHFKDRDKSKANMFSLLAFCFRKINDLDNALTSAMSACKFDPEDSSNYQLLGHIYMDKSDIINANEQFKVLLKKAPNNQEGLFFLGVTEGLLGNLNTAAKVFKELITFAPTDYEAHYNLGFTFQKQNRFQEAIDCYNITISLQPDYTDCLINRGNCRIQLRQKKQACIDFTRALELGEERAQENINEHCT